MQGQSRVREKIIMSEKPTTFGASSVEILLSLLEIRLMHSRSYGLAACANE
jgi:hypothetical protein